VADVAMIRTLSGYNLGARTDGLGSGVGTEDARLTRVLTNQSAAASPVLECEILGFGLRL
jgi:hypothetical protein